MQRKSDSELVLNHFRSLRNVNRNVLVLGLSSSVATFANTIWLFFFPLILEGEGASVAQVGIVYGLAAVCSALLQIPAGAFADRFGRKTAIVIGSVSPSVAVLVISFSSNLILSSAAFVAYLAVGGTFFSIGRSALITESVSKEKLATSFGTFTTMAGWLSLFAPTLGSLYLGKDMRAVLLISVLLYASVAITRALFLKETFHGLPTKSSKGQADSQANGKVSLENQQVSKFKTFSSNFRFAISNRTLIALTLAYAIYGILFSQPSFVVTIYSTNVIHLNPFQLGLMFSIFLLVDSQLQIPFGMMADRWDKKKIIIVSWLGEMAMMMVFVYSVGPIFALLSFAAWTALGSLDGPAISALLGIITQTETRGFSFGFFRTFSLVFLIPAPILTGFLYSLDPTLPFYVLLGIDLVALVFFLRFINLKNDRA